MEANNELIGAILLTENQLAFGFSENVDILTINITVTSTDGFAGLNRLPLLNLVITDIEIIKGQT